MDLPLKNIRKIILFRALQLGDVLCSIPAVRALRNQYPDAEIVIAGLPWASTLTGRFPAYFNRFIHFPGYPGLPEQAVDAKGFTRFLGAVQRERFDLALQMQGNGTLVNPMIELFAARFTAGFCPPNDYCPDSELFLPYPNYGSEIERHLKLTESMGIESCGTQLEFPVYDQDRQDLEQLNLNLRAGSYVCVHPGSRGSWRQWPTEYFAALADRCCEKGLKVVITGTAEELAIVNEVREKMKYSPLVAAGKTSLGAVAALLENAFALISNCTGVSHIASALKLKSVVISMDGEPERWAQTNRKLHLVIDWTKTPDFERVANALEETLSAFEV